MTDSCLSHNKQLLYSGSYSVHDHETVQARDDLIHKFTELDCDRYHVAEKIKRDFLGSYREWMCAEFNFPGIDRYEHACFTHGTTESFAQFYLRYRVGYRLRLYKSEYFYHQMMKSLWYQDNFAWLDEDDICRGDVVLISVPFSDTGDIPPNFDSILDACDDLEVPVMLDLAYVNLTVGDAFPHVIDFNRPCIQYVVTSLSKVFPVENLRIGMRLQKHFFEDQLYVTNGNEYNYINLLSAYVGHGMITKFSPGEMFNRYRDRQIQKCRELDIDVSPCFIFGIDRNNRFQEYHRGGASNRLCFSRSWDDRHIKLNLKSGL